MSSNLSSSPDELIPLVQVAGELRKLVGNKPNVPNYSRLKSDTYSGKFDVERVGGKLAVRRDGLRAIAALYGLGGVDQVAVAA